jgi:crossover junction endodeoxyribonuclease RuvC
MRILAIDPGYDRVGIAVIGGNASKPEVVHSECLLTKRTDRRENRLAEIADRFKKIIKLYKPEKVAIETLFFSVNQKTAIGVAESRGAIMAEAGRAGIAVVEFNPNSVKAAVTGYGASKKQGVIDMVKRLVKINRKVKYDDEYDAIAIGITALATLKTELK